MNLVDKAVAFLSPSRGLKRMQNNMAIQFLAEHQRKFDGATKGRRLGAWGTTNGSVNSEISQSLADLRSRSRSLCQNNPYAKNAPKRIANNVVGTGIILTPVHGSLNKSAEAAFKKAWKKWADSTDCDFNDQLNFYGLQHQGMQSVVRNGEMLAIRVKKRYKKGEIPLEIQLLDPEFIDTQKNTLQINSGADYIINGVEFNKAGKKVAYWIFDRHPRDFNAISKRHPAEDVCHVYDLDEAGQVRGVPFFSSIILRMKDFDDYEDAQLIRQKIAACFTAFRTRPDANIAPVGADKDASGNLLERMEPGIIEDLAPGESITFGTPPVTEGFAEYSRQNLQGQAIGLGMSYESFTGDLSNVNFSSGRMGWIEFQRNIEQWQWNMLQPMFLNRVFEWFMNAAFVSGLIPDKDFLPTWTPPRREMIDPAKEVKGMIEQVRGGFISWQDAVRQLGYIPEDIMAEMIKDKTNFDAAGLMPTSDPRYDADRMNKEGKAEGKKDKVKQE